MNIGKTLFAQLIDFLPWTTFARYVQRYGGDGGVRTLPCAEQFRIMAFVQLTYRESLRERHAAVLIGTTEIADSMIAAVTLDDAAEGLPRKMIHQLGEQQFADVHALHLCGKRRQIRAVRRSDRRHTKNGTLLQQFSGLQNSERTLTGQ